MQKRDQPPQPQAQPGVLPAGIYTSPAIAGNRQTETEIMRLRTLIALTAAAAALLAAPVASATASAAAARPSFATQAHDAGLTNAEARTLQDEVTAFVRAHGGTQTSYDEVNLTGHTILLVVPTATHAPGSPSRGPAADLTCPAYTFCAYHGTNYTNGGSGYSPLELSPCGVYTPMPWTNVGSWKNDQSTGTPAYFYNADFQLVLKTPGAWSANPSYNWAPVYYIEACK